MDKEKPQKSMQKTFLIMFKTYGKSLYDTCKTAKIK
jgi:hypothetical protein